MNKLSVRFTVRASSYKHQCTNNIFFFPKESQKIKNSQSDVHLFLGIPKTYVLMINYIEMYVI